MGKEQEKTQKAKFSVWLANLSYIGVLITLILIVVQVYYAKQTMIESNEWEKAKVTIENIERFKERLKETALYGKIEVLWFSGNLWPDLTTLQGYNSSDTLQIIYRSLFVDKLDLFNDFEKTLAIMDDFSYPIIMGYASDLGSFQNTIKEYYSYGNYIIPIALHSSGYKHVGNCAKLLYKLWRIRAEIIILKDYDFAYIKKEANKNNLLCFDETEITPASIERYIKKLEKELKKIQKEIEEFRKNSLK